MGEKFLQIQQQMRHDNTDLQDYIRDLKNWETDIKQKDKALRQENVTDEVILPPVRNQTKKKTKETPKKKTKTNTEISQTDKPRNGTPPGTARIPAYDYRSWDKFDADKACAQLDSDEEDPPATTQNEDDETMESDTDSEEERELERQRRIQQASMEKDKGNVLFKNGQYDDAVVCYTAGMEADPTNAILPANRAMARLKLKRYEDAEKDCDMSISLDCTYVKAYARRATARSGLGRLEEAKKDYQQVLNLEPANKQAVVEIKRIDRITKEREDTERQKRDGVYNIIHAVQKPVHLRSKKPLKRMVIEEIGKENGDEDSMATSATPHKPQETTPKESQCTAQGSRLSSQTDPGPDGDPIGSEMKQSQGKSDNPHTKVKVDSKTPSMQPGPLKVTSPDVPSIPSSSYQLQTDWKTLKKHPQQLFQYFKKIPPRSYPQLFQQSLDSTLLMRILSLLEEQYVEHDEPVYECLENLSLVKRFDMNIMFMSSQDKQVVQKLFNFMQTSGMKTTEDLDKLAKKYNL